MTRTFLTLFLIVFGISLSCSPKPDPVRSVKDLRSDQVKEALPLPTTQPNFAATPAPEHADNEDQNTNPLQAVIYNQLLARSEGNVDIEALSARIEEKTGAKVKSIRKGALGLLQITFEEIDPPRDQNAQKALVEKIKHMRDFKSVEVERLMLPRGK